MQDLDHILEQDFGIEEILHQQVLTQSMGMHCAHHYSKEVQGFARRCNLN